MCHCYCQPVVVLSTDSTLFCYMSLSFQSYMITVYNVAVQVASVLDRTTTLDGSIGTNVSHSVVINTTSCASLLANTVAHTSGYNIDRLLRLHHEMSVLIYQHRRSYDKTSLLQVRYYYCLLCIQFNIRDDVASYHHHHGIRFINRCNNCYLYVTAPRQKHVEQTMDKCY